MLKNINSTSPIPKYSPRCRRESFTPAKLCQTTHVYRVDLHALFTFPFGEITSQIHKLWCKSESPCSTTLCSRHPPNCVIRAMKRSYSTEQCANVFYVARFARNIPKRSLWLIYAIALGYLCFKSCLRVFFCLQFFHIHKLCLFCS